MFFLKKLKAKCLGFVACGIFTAFLAATTVYADNIAVITGDNVNVRSEPNTNSTVLKKVNSGEAIDIVSLDSNGWYKIKLNNDYAYVTKEFVEIVQIDGVVTDDRINIREGSSTDTKILGTLNKGDVISITGSEGAFYMFDMNGSTGYIFKNYVNVDGSFSNFVKEEEQVEIIKIPPEAPPVNKMETPTYAKVTSSTGVNFRKGPSTDTAVIFALASGDLVDVLEKHGDWYRVSYSGVEGYVRGDFLELHTGSKPDISVRTQKVNALISFAKKYIGTPYVWGGTNLNRGVDCSGFVYSVFKNFGYALNRTSRDQAKNGTRISRSELSPGDLIFFDTNLNGTISHVGIYIGDGKFIHSSSGRKTMSVTISGINESYYVSRYVTATRIIN